MGERRLVELVTPCRRGRGTCPGTATGGDRRRARTRAGSRGRSRARCGRKKASRAAGRRPGCAPDVGAEVAGGRASRRPPRRRAGRRGGGRAGRRHRAGDDRRAGPVVVAREAEEVGEVGQPSSSWRLRRPVPPARPSWCRRGRPAPGGVTRKEASSSSGNSAGGPGPASCGGVGEARRFDDHRPSRRGRRHDDHRAANRAGAVTANPGGRRRRPRPRHSSRRSHWRKSTKAPSPRQAGSGAPISARAHRAPGGRRRRGRARCRRGRGPTGVDRGPATP